MNKFIKLRLVAGAACMLLIPALSYAQASKNPESTTTIGYFYSASGQMVDAEDNRGVMSSCLTRGERYNGTNETFAVSDIKDVTADLDSNGNVLNKYTYTAYGTTTSYPSTVANPSSNRQNQALSIKTNPFIYFAYYIDSESGNYYLNARYYDPTLGIFLTSDSYNLPNRYMYVNGNPVMVTDPTGHNIFHIIAHVLTCGIAYKNRQDVIQQFYQNRQQEEQNRNNNVQVVQNENNEQKWPLQQNYEQMFPTNNAERIYVGKDLKAYYVIHPDANYTFGIKNKDGSVCETKSTRSLNEWKPGWGTDAILELYRNTLPKGEDWTQNGKTATNMNTGDKLSYRSEGGTAYVLKKDRDEFVTVAQLQSWGTMVDYRFIVEEKRVQFNYFNNQGQHFIIKGSGRRILEHEEGVLTVDNIKNLFYVENLA